MRNIVCLLAALLLVSANACPFLRSEPGVDADLFNLEEGHGQRRLQAKPAPPSPPAKPAPEPAPAPKPAPAPAPAKPAPLPSWAPTKSNAGVPTAAPSFQGCSKPLVQSAANTCSVYSSAKADLTAAVAANGASNIFGAAVRLAFHDAGEVDITSAADLNGPDGCLSYTSANAGLIEATSLVNTVIEPVWQKYCDKISRADFWVLFAKMSVERADPTGSIKIPFHYGRKDKSSCQSGAGRLPNAGKGLDEISRVFVTQMGLTLSNAVTLLGAHTLGHTHIPNSGYGAVNFPPNTPNDAKNAWDDTPGVFDNHYYQNMIQRNWNNVQATVPNQDQWVAPVPSLMLNADMSLGFSIDTTNAQGVVGQRCGPTAINGNTYGCAQPTNAAAPSTRTQVASYAANNALFLSDFATAFSKMTTAGYGVGSAGKLGALTSLDLATCSA